MAPYAGDSSTWPAAKPVSPPEPGFSAVYRNAVDPLPAEVTRTPADIFRKTVAAVPDQPFLGRRKWDFVKGDFAPVYTWTTYAQAYDQVHALGYALTSLISDRTLQPDPDSGLTAALWSPNVPEFQILMQQTHIFSRRLVNIFDSFPLDSALYVLAHSEAQVVFTTGAHLVQLLPNLDQLPKVKVIVIVDEQPAADAGAGRSSNVLPTKLPPTQASKQQISAAWAESEGARVFDWEQLLALGKTNPTAIPPAAGLDHIPLLCYTSGSTGQPKGALVSSRQLSFAAEAANKGGAPLVEHHCNLFSYLPVAHIYEVLLETLIVSHFGGIGYSCGDTTRLLEDMQILKPHVFPSVPRVLNRIAGAIELQMRGESFKAKLLRRAVESKMAYHDVDGQVQHAFWDRIVFKKVQALLGGNVECIISGSAPIRPETLKLLRVCFATDVREGFGATENLATASINLAYDKELGSVGAIVPGLELRLQDQPELGYHATDKPRPRGEILLRGPSVFPGYFKDPEKTAETLDADGWLHTGDVGAIDERGRLYIIDRIKVRD